MKITKWKVMQKDSSIGLLLLIISGLTLLLIVLGPTTIGVKYNGTPEVKGPLGVLIPSTSHWVHATLGNTNGVAGATWTTTGEALAVVGMVFAGISWLSICIGWYVDPTTVDERITLSISAAAAVIALVFAIAGPAYENNQYTQTNKGYLAGMEILAIIPSVATMLLMVEPLIMVFNPNYKSKAGLEYKKYEKDLEAQESKKISK